MDDTSTVTAPPPDLDAPRPPVGARRRERLLLVATAVLAIWALVATALWLGGRSDPRAGVREAAIRFITELTTWDATEDGLDATIAALRDLGTGDFLDQVDDVLGDEARATAEEVGATSSGEIIEVLVSEIADGQATAIVIVNQVLAVDGDQAEQEQVARMEFTLVDGRWLVSRSELLNSPAPLGVTEDAG